MFKFNIWLLCNCILIVNALFIKPKSNPSSPKSKSNPGSPKQVTHFKEILPQKTYSNGKIGDEAERALATMIFGFVNDNKEQWAIVETMVNQYDDMRKGKSIQPKIRTLPYINFFFFF